MLQKINVDIQIWWWLIFCFPDEQWGLEKICNIWFNHQCAHFFACSIFNLIAINDHLLPNSIWPQQYLCSQALVCCRCTATCPWRYAVYPTQCTAPSLTSAVMTATSNFCSHHCTIVCRISSATSTECVAMCYNMLQWKLSVHNA